MRKIFVSLFLTTTICLLSLSFSLACSSDVECPGGGACIRYAGSVYGECAGSLFPVDFDDTQLIYSSLNVSQAYGNPCSVDSICAPGSVCVKASGAIYGTCMKQNY
ncbi:MAG: hypothetical protein PHT50_07790 [Candidatus Omnitrophica bacterium]|nr:hypothetical protein [Candidatus Omnitrophota bacterium]